MRMIEVSDKQLLALKAVVHGCNTNKRLVGASYMSNIRSEKPEMISYYEAIKTVDEMLSQPTIEAEPVVRCKDCKHWMKDVPGCTDFVGRCCLANYMIGATGYCVYVERMSYE